MIHISEKDARIVSKRPGWAASNSFSGYCTLFYGDTTEWTVPNVVGWLSYDHIEAMYVVKIREEKGLYKSIYFETLEEAVTYLELLRKID